MYARLRPLLFRLDPEKAHHYTLQLLRLTAAIPGGTSLLKTIYPTKPDPIKLFGLTFKNRVGLAAGYDKDAIAWRGLAGLGFGHIEIGTVTPQPQSGNPKPRVFRLPEDQALINRMGFPSRGADFVQKRLAGSTNRDVVLGVNLGKNKETPLELAVNDYAQLIQTFSPYADYLTINISSPNTPGLRKLQTKAYLNDLLKNLNQTRKNQFHPRPLLVKLSPDLADQDLDQALDAILANQIDGVIASNTTIQRAGLTSPNANEQGGLSGKSLLELSTQIIHKIIQRTEDKLPVIAVGGIMNPVDAQQKFDAGAKLVQIYTGMIYSGPMLLKQINSTCNKIS